MLWLMLVVAVAMFVVGRWGARRVPQLISPHLDEEQREKQERVMRRGAWVLQIVAVALVCLAAFTLVRLEHWF
jgi:hypothetical protein